MVSYYVASFTSNLKEFVRTYLFTFYQRILIYTDTVLFVYRHTLSGAGFRLFSPFDLSGLFISNISVFNSLPQLFQNLDHTACL